MMLYRVLLLMLCARALHRTCLAASNAGGLAFFFQPFILFANRLYFEGATELRCKAAPPNVASAS
jgi:hypothetical protein